MDKYGIGKISFVELFLQIKIEKQFEELKEEIDMFPGETVLTGAKSHKEDPNITEFKVLNSVDRWYIGTLIYDKDSDSMKPWTRETYYFDSEEQAKKALDKYRETGILDNRRIV